MDPAPLLPVDDAVRTVLDHVPEPRVIRVPLADSLGRILAEDVRSDVDMPPFDRSMMDGYAVRSADLSSIPADLAVLETVHAGDVPTRALGPGDAVKIMTGAPVPETADAVVMVERTEALDGGRVRIHETVPRGRNIAPRGQDVEVGARVLDAGRAIRPDEIAVLAAAGMAEVPIFAPPRIAVFATGDEVVPARETPGPGKIRNSNSPALTARAVRDGAVATDHGILPDDLETTRRAVEGALGENDLVLLTGGVSMGDRDLVGAALAAAGFSKVFHKVRLKPGKPTLFGTAGRTLVFGLPGNPVSVAVTYETLVRPAVRRLSGQRPFLRPRVLARLVSPAPKAIPREQHLPAVLVFTEGEWRVSVCGWHGSGDLAGFSSANALLVVTADGPATETGAIATVVVLDDDLGALLPDARDG